MEPTRSYPKIRKNPVRITPPLPENIVIYDYELCKKLITLVFDPEKGIDSYLIQAIEEMTIEAPSNDQ